MATYDYIKGNTIENDYIERDGRCDELTVTITLAEYRALIENTTRDNAIIDRLTDENEELKKRLQASGELIMSARPDIAKKIADFAQDLIGTKENDDADVKM